MAIMGDVGVGKTSLFKTLDPKTTIVIDAENGMKGLDLSKVSAYFSLRVDDAGKVLSESERMARLHTILKELVLPKYTSKYKTVFLDTISEVGRLIYSVASSKYDGFKLWGAYNKQLLDVIVALRDVGHYDIVMTCGERHVVDEATNVNYYTVDFASENSRKAFRSCMDEVYRLIKVDGVRKFVTQETARTQAKNRLGGLEALEDADLDKVLKKLKGVK